MAGEAKGVAYEALTKLILEDLKADGKLKGRIFWGEKPDDMTIKPDLTIGRSSNAPKINILITHSGSAKNSDMKFWRNMGELVESKVFLPSPAKVFNLAFDSVIKENLKKLQAASFDGQLIVGDRPYGDDVQAWLDSNLKDFPKDKDEKVIHLRDLRASDKELARLCKLLCRDIAVLLAKRAPVALSAIWKMERARVHGTPPASRDTFVRRGLGKILVFDDLDLALRLHNGKNVRQEDVPEYAYEIGLARKFTAGGGKGIAKPVDEEILNAVRLLSDSDVRSVCREAPLENMSRWIYPLRSLGDLSEIYDFIYSNFAGLCKPVELLEYLQKVHRNPNSLLKKKLMLQTNWLYFVLVDLLKATSNLGQGFGYAQLLRKIKADVDEVNLFLRSQKLDPVILRGQSFIVRGLTDWLGRLETQQAKSFGKSFQGAVAFVLASELSGLDSSSFPSLSELREKVVQSNLEQKLVTYRNFQPLECLINLNAAKAKKKKIGSCFGSRANSRQGSGETTVILEKHTIINWQSAHHSHTNDKKKELCGRAVALRYSWDAKAKKFIPRPGVEKLVLVVDGTWTQGNLEALVRAGWDEIFYPDEMDKLAKAIV